VTFPYARLRWVCLVPPADLTDAWRQMCAGWYLPNPMLLPDIRPGRRGVLRVSFGSVVVVEHALQHRGELADLVGREAGQELAGDAPEDGGQAWQECPPLLGELDDDGSAVVWVLAALQEPLAFKAVKKPGHARGVGPEQRHQLTRAALLPSRLQQQRRLLGGDVERGELTLQRCAQLTPDLVEERAATEDQADGDALARLRVWGLSVWDWTRRHAFMVDAPELAVMTATC